MNVVVDCREELLCCVCSHRLGLYVVVICLVSVLNADWSEEWATIQNIVLAIMRNVEIILIIIFSCCYSWVLYQALKSANVLPLNRIFTNEKVICFWTDEVE